MVMNEIDRKTTLKKYIGKIYRQIGDTALMDGLEIRAAVNSVDDWVDTNTESFNTSLPEPFKTVATPTQKSLLLAFVVMKKYGII